MTVKNIKVDEKEKMLKVTYIDGSVMYISFGVFDVIGSVVKRKQLAKPLTEPLMQEMLNNTETKQSIINAVNNNMSNFL